MPGRSNTVTIAFMAVVGIVLAGLLGLQYLGRDISATAAILLPFIVTLAGLVGISKKVEDVQAGVQKVETKVNGNLDAKLDMVHAHLDAAGFPDPRPAPYTDATDVGISATGVDDEDGPHD